MRQCETRVSQNHLWMFSGGGPMHCGAIAIYAKKITIYAKKNAIYAKKKR